MKGNKKHQSSEFSLTGKRGVSQEAYELAQRRTTPPIPAAIHQHNGCDFAPMFPRKDGIRAYSRQEFFPPHPIHLPHSFRTLYSTASLIVKLTPKQKALTSSTLKPRAKCRFESLHFQAQFSFFSHHFLYKLKIWLNWTRHRSWYMPTSIFPHSALWGLFLYMEYISSLSLSSHGYPSHTSPEVQYLNFSRNHSSPQPSKLD